MADSKKEESRDDVPKYVESTEDKDIPKSAESEEVSESVPMEEDIVNEVKNLQDRNEALRTEVNQLKKQIKESRSKPQISKETSTAYFNMLERLKKKYDANVLKKKASENKEIYDTSNESGLRTVYGFQIEALKKELSTCKSDIGILSAFLKENVLVEEGGSTSAAGELIPESSSSAPELFQGQPFIAEFLEKEKQQKKEEGSLIIKTGLNYQEINKKQEQIQYLNEVKNGLKVFRRYKVYLDNLKDEGVLDAVNEAFSKNVKSHFGLTKEEEFRSMEEKLREHDLEKQLKEVDSTIQRRLGLIMELLKKIDEESKTNITYVVDSDSEDGPSDKDTENEKSAGQQGQFGHSSDSKDSSSETSKTKFSGEGQSTDSKALPAKILPAGKGIPYDKKGLPVKAKSSSSDKEACTEKMTISPTKSSSSGKETHTEKMTISPTKSSSSDKEAHTEKMTISPTKSSSSGKETHTEKMTISPTKSSSSDKEAHTEKMSISPTKSSSSGTETHIEKMKISPWPSVVGSGPSVKVEIQVPGRVLTTDNGGLSVEVIIPPSGEKGDVRAESKDYVVESEVTGETPPAGGEGFSTAGKKISSAGVKEKGQKHKSEDEKVLEIRTTPPKTKNGSAMQRDMDSSPSPLIDNVPQRQTSESQGASTVEEESSSKTEHSDVRKNAVAEIRERNGAVIKKQSFKNPEYPEVKEIRRAIVKKYYALLK